MSGFNVEAVPFQPRTRANSQGDSTTAAPPEKQQASSATGKSPIIPPRDPDGPNQSAGVVESYSARAKRAITKDDEKKAQLQAGSSSNSTTPKSTPKSGPRDSKKHRTATAGAENSSPDQNEQVKDKKSSIKGDGPRDKGKDKTEKHVKITVKYSRDKLKQLKSSTWKWQLNAVQEEERVDHPPFSNVPSSYSKYFELRAHSDFINWESPLMQVPSRRKRNVPADVPPEDLVALPPSTTPSQYQQEQLKQQARNSPGKVLGTSPYSRSSTPDQQIQGWQYYCTMCASSENSGSEMIPNLIHSVKKKAKDHGCGFLTQSGDVVIGSVQLILAFEHRATSRRMKMLSERLPKVKALVKEYLCGEGFHIPPPSLTNDEAWSLFLGKLKFDYIRDNRTKIFTELSKHWKRSHTKFEQFAHFCSFRDALPYFPTVGMITNQQKPMLVACSTGDIEAAVLLGEQGYHVMADVLWDMLPYYDNLPAPTYATLRHLCVYYFQRQQRRLLASAYSGGGGFSPGLPPMTGSSQMGITPDGIAPGAPPPGGISPIMQAATGEPVMTAPPL